MKDLKSYLCIIALFVSMSLMAQESDKLPSNPNGYHVLCFGNDKYMLFQDFMEAADTSASLHSVMDIYSFEIVDPDSIPQTLRPYSFFSNVYPTFVIINDRGEVLNFKHGYMDEPDLISFLYRADSIPNIGLSISLVEKLYQKSLRKKRSNDRYMNMCIRGRHYDFSVGYNISFLSGENPFSGNSMGGCSATIGFRQYVSGRVGIATGLSIDRYGSKSSSNGYLSSINETMLSVPLETEFYLFRRFADVSVRAGVWGGYLISDNINRNANQLPMVSSNDLNKWDIGANTALVLQFGSFDFSVGYRRGFIDRFNSDDISGFTNAINFSVRVRYGD